MNIKILFKSPAILILSVFSIFSCSSDNESAAKSEVSKASGTYVLTELNVSPAQDINEDGTASTNLLDELPCISGTLVLRSNETYDFNLTGIEVNIIANGAFFINCANARNSNSNWNIQNGLVTLFGDFTTTPYLLVDDVLSRAIEEDLPGIQGVVYIKQ